VAILVRVTPKASVDRIEGVAVLSDGRPVLKVRTRAVPEDGRANRALVALLARVTRRPKSCVTIEGGAASRLKRVAIEGTAAEILRHLEAACSGAE